jgi:hypothetical protein
VKIGYKLFAEAFSPKDLVAQAIRAEEAGRQVGPRHDPVRPARLEGAVGAAEPGQLRGPCPDPEGFFEFFARDLAEPLRALTSK